MIDLSAYPRPYGGNAASPFRYPGGKGFLTPFLADEISRRFGDIKPSYAEPYCGGAGAATNLLLSGSVERLLLNDADHRVYSAWKAMLSETERFLERVATAKVNLETWHDCIEKLHSKPDAVYDFNTGFAAFFINRTSRSGVLLGSGPIGGYSQEGNWKIDARFNREALSNRIQRLGDRRENIVLSCQDGLSFCKELEMKQVLAKTFLFVDPPYIEAGGRLYYDGMTEAKHDALANWLRSDSAPHWLLTYDDHPLVRENYEGLPEHKIQVQYSLARRRAEKELLYKSSY